MQRPSRIGTELPGNGPRLNPYFATQLAAIEPAQDLVDAERPLKELTEHPGWKFLVSMIEARAEGLQREVLAVDATNHIGYIVNAAEQRVLRAVLDLPKDAASKAAWVDEKHRRQLEAHERLKQPVGGRTR